MNDEKLEQLEKENALLKDMVILLSKVYQDNFDTFANPYNYSIDVKNQFGSDIHSRASELALNFYSIQGSTWRDLVEEIATLKTKNPAINSGQIKAMFDYDRKEAREKIHKEKFSKEAKEKQMELVKRIFLRIQNE
jgi:hypothetical protein